MICLLVAVTGGHCIEQSVCGIERKCRINVVFRIVAHYCNRPARGLRARRHVECVNLRVRVRDVHKISGFVVRCGVGNTERTARQILASTCNARG